MTRHLYKLTLLAAAVLSITGLAGCADDTSNGGYSGEPALELEISRTGLASRASVGTDFTEAEKTIRSVDLFFYPNNATDDTPALHYARVLPEMSKDPLTSHTGRIVTSVPKDVLFGETGTTCRVYAAVNTDATKDKQGLTLGELKGLKITSSSFVNETLPDENADDLSSFKGFVMFSSASDGTEVTYNRAENKITGTIIVSKQTSKIDLYVGYGEQGGEREALVITAPHPNNPSGPTHDWKVYSKDEHATEAFIVNGVQAVRLSGYTATTKVLDFLTPDDYFDYRQDGQREYARQFRLSEATDKETYPYVLKAPFYTYPNEWSTDVLEQHRTHLLLKVNWLPDGGTVENDLLETYYMIPLNVTGDSKNQIMPNHYYRVKVKINTLGGQHFGEPLLLEECDYEILPWGEADIDATLRDTRFLDVRQQEVDKDDGKVYTAIMNGTDMITIPFYSSHATVVESVTISYENLATWDFNGNNQDQYVNSGSKNVTVTIDASKFSNPNYSLEDLIKNDWHGAYIDNISNTITVRHPVGLTVPDGDHCTYNNGYNYRYTPYIITIKLNHSDGDAPGESRTITIRHNPAIYVETEVNTSFNLTGETGTGNINKIIRDYDMFCHYVFPGYKMFFFGFARINGDANYTNGDRGYSSLNGCNFGGLLGLDKAPLLSNANVDNPVMYVINATTLTGEDEFSKYHIADPRCNYSNTDLNDDVLFDNEEKTGSGWYAARHIDPDKGTNWSLRYYYPTNEGLAEEDMYAISPKFRMCSSFGSQASKIDKKTARKRCASYSEYGYPAGRWRLPTVGEIEFVNSLSKRGVIPALFKKGDDYPYITAQGIYVFDNAGNIKEKSESTGYTRCVYDDWYWVKADGTPDNLKTIAEIYNNEKVFIWGDREKKNPQKQ